MTGTSLDQVPQLARPGDPLVLASGQILEPLKLPNFLPKLREETKTDPAKFRGKKQKNISELPAPPNMLNAIAAVMLYSFYGVGDREIADTLKCTVVELEAIRNHAAYAEYFETLSEQIISADSDSIKHRIAAYQHAALDKVAAISVHGKKEENALRASIDLLDRGGNTAKNANDVNMQKNTLRIQLISEKGDQTNINVEIGQ